MTYAEFMDNDVPLLPVDVWELRMRMKRLPADFASPELWVHLVHDAQAVIGAVPPAAREPARELLRQAQTYIGKRWPQLAEKKP